MTKQEKSLQQLEVSFGDELVSLVRTQDLAALKGLAEKYYGKNSKLTEVLRSLREISDPEEKKKVGQLANALKVKLAEKIEKEMGKLSQKVLERQLQEEAIDPTRPGINTTTPAHAHVVSTTVKKIEDIFLSMGFDVEYSNEVDNAFNTFDALNIPQNHPARDNWDTLWLEDGNLAIPHTSAMQNRILSATDVPIRKVSIGKCFRNEATDARHEHTFMQVEGVYLDRTANMGEMVGVLLEFFENYFGRKLQYKFTPDFFPFVEPGGQMAIECIICHSKGCRVCKYSGFLEVLGCGMIHPKVIQAAGKDPNRCAGFAWGFGVERILLIKESIDDIRNFYSGDLRFTSQFS